MRSLLYSEYPVQHTCVFNYFANELRHHNLMYFNKPAITFRLSMFPDTITHPCLPRDVSKPQSLHIRDTALSKRP